MKFHPAVLIMLSWSSAFLLFAILPFSLESRIMTMYGYLITAVFLAVFCAGALLASRPMPQFRRDPNVTINFRRSDQVLMIVGLICTITFMLDIQNSNVLDLAAAYEARSDRATDLLQGAASDSSIFFQLGFLLYPAGYVFMVREIAFKSRPQAWRIGLFGMAPVTLAALAMGGRGPLFFLIVFAVYAYMLRKQVFPITKRAPTARPGVRTPTPRPAALSPLAINARSRSPRRTPFRFGPGFKLAMAIIAGVFMIYFVQVFVERADVGGGIDAVFGTIGLNWGVGFNGRFSNVFYSLFGVEGTYMIFVFSWYWLQGIIMSNQIFSFYDGPMLLGTYGIDLVSAAMRRINGEFVGAGFDRLLRMNVYGFVPSAFGSLYVDFKFFGLIPCLIWGWLVGFVYRKVKMGVDPRYLMLVPFVSVCIVMSLNNTPIGMSNGLMLHFWLLVTFFLARPQVIGAQVLGQAAPARSPGIMGIPSPGWARGRG